MRAPCSTALLCRLAGAAIAVGTLEGCGPVATAGVHRKLAFAYRVAGETRDVGPSLAAGSEVDLLVYAIDPPAAGAPRKKKSALVLRDGLEPSDVRVARSRRPDVVAVVSMRGPSVGIRAQAAGSAVLDVDAFRGSDQIVLRVEDVHHFTVTHWADMLFANGASAFEAAFLRGARGRFTVRAHGATGNRLVGLGGGEPISLAPEGAGPLKLPTAESFDAEIRFDRPGITVIRPRGGTSREIPVIERSDVRGLAIARIDTGARAPAGMIRSLDGIAPKPNSNVLLAVQGELDGGRRVVVLGEGIRVTSTTPNVCAPHAAESGDGPVVIEALSPGRCELEARLDAHVARAELTVVPPPPKPDGAR